MRTKLTILIFILILVSCSNKSSEILKVELADMIWYTEKFTGWREEYVGSIVEGYYINERGGWNKYESFVISNPPKNKSELLTLVNDFNSKTMNKDSILKYDRKYIRHFYKKTWKTRQAYKADNFETATSWLDDARDDELLTVSWCVNDECSIEIWSNYYGDSKSDMKNMFNVADEELFYLK